MTMALSSPLTTCAAYDSSFSAFTKKIFRPLCLLTVLCTTSLCNAETPSKDIATDSTIDFTYSLVKQMKRKEPFVIAPFTLFSSLSLLYMGAREETAVQIAKILRLGAYRKPLSEDLTPSLQLLKKIQASQALGLWLDKDTFILTSFLHLADSLFGAGIASIDFADTKTACSIVNTWTQNQLSTPSLSITQIDDFSSNTRMLSTSGFSFKGGWKTPFDEKSTRQEPFHLDDNKRADVPMMDLKAPLLYTETDKYYIVALETLSADGTLSPLLFCMNIPKAQGSFEELFTEEQALSYKNALKNLEIRQVHLQLPKIDIQQIHHLKTSLNEMGMNEAFTKGANFSGIDGMKDLILNEVIHAASLSICENGINFEKKLPLVALNEPKEKPLDIFANRPFTFALVHKDKGTSYLFGRFTTPFKE